MSALIIAVVVIVLLWANSQYWLAPIVFRRSWRWTPRVSDLRPVAEADVHPRFAGVLEQYRLALEPLGFVPTPLLVNEKESGSSYIQVFEHPRNGDLATVIAVPDPEQPLPTSLIGFTSVVGGVELCTGNSPVVSGFPTQPGTESVRFPAERDPARLYALHRARVKRSGHRPQPIRVGDPVAYQHREEAEGYKHWVESGYCFQDGTELRPTWKGAVCMPYRLLFPWKHLREWRDELLRRRLLPEAGLA